MMRHTRIIVGILAGALAAGAVAVAAPAAGETRESGRIVAVQPLRSLTTKEDVARELTAAEFKVDEVRYGVDTYQLVYRTVDPAGRPTIASGLVALPRGGARELRVVSYTHGTEINRTDAPSMWRDGWAVAPALTYASAGFAAVAPDYLGMGIGPGPHPYLDVPSETTAALDLLRAAREFTAGKGRALERKVLVTGFSQGGTAATGLARALATGADGWFRLGALSPIAGPYDGRRQVLPVLASMPPPFNTGYTAYLLVSYNRLHHIYDKPSDVFEKEGVEEVFDGVHTGEELAETLGGSVDDLLTPRGKALIDNPTGPFAAALAVHDGTCTGWTPRAPVRLVVSGGDEQIVVGNATACRASFAASGVDVPVVDAGDLVYNDSKHLGANVMGTADTVKWFKTL
ncbi:alpha/beta hydrolase family protein [Phytohabitans sp. LJ34]|uniref:alpha/beta hydrolase family protein n=1 Tax=Phytohabitans sp. LJ34 TaxID=3452217 RepID=UPI003F895F92